MDVKSHLARIRDMKKHIQNICSKAWKEDTISDVLA